MGDSHEPTALTLRGVARRFGRRWALRGITLDAAPGEIVGVMGHNGSGKSTLLRVLSTVLRPSAGDAWIFGHHLVRESTAVRALTGFLAHSPGLYDDLTGAENLRFAVAMLAADEALVAPTLERVGLWRERDERVRGYSAGMQRRLALGRVLLGKPKLLLLDEPYNNFDSDGVALVNDVIAETRERGGSVLVVLHDRRQGDRLLDRTIELARGVIASDDGQRPPVRESRSAPNASVAPGTR